VLVLAMLSFHEAFSHRATAKALKMVHLETGEKAPERKKPAKAAPKILLLIIVLVVEKSRFVIILRDGKMEN
jgi:hypothetical protein